jgi:hypothetical protein
MIRWIWIDADLKQRADESQWAVIDGIYQARPNFEGHWPIRHDTGIVDRSAQRLEIAKTKSRVDSLEPLVSRAPFRLYFHGWSNLTSFSSFGGYFVC